VLSFKNSLTSSSVKKCDPETGYAINIFATEEFLGMAFAMTASADKTPRSREFRIRPAPVNPRPVCHPD
jgi:hypothetical protein